VRRSFFWKKLHYAAVLEKDKIVDISKVLMPLTLEQIKTLNKEDLAFLLHQEQRLRLQFQTFYSEILATNVELQEKKLLLEEQYVLLKNRFFAKSSEKSPRS
jgi:hypothetical protein